MVPICTSPKSAGGEAGAKKAKVDPFRRARGLRTEEGAAFISEDQCEAAAFCPANGIARSSLFAECAGERELSNGDSLCSPPIIAIVAKLQLELGKFRKVACPGVYLGTLQGQETL